MPKDPPPEEPELGAPAWMLTYGDMVTLVLTFFVLLVSIMVVDPKKFVEVLGTYEKMTAEGYDRPTEDDPQQEKDYFQQIIKVAARRSEVLEGGDDVTQEGEAVRVFAFEENYVVSMTDQPFFNRFEILLTDSAKRRLTHLARKLKERNEGHMIKVIGHYAPDEENFESLKQVVSFQPRTDNDDDFERAAIDGEVRALIREFEQFNASGINAFDQAAHKR
ncbi:MAG: hypothetical protein KDB07_13635, partial [Planctomycetes bacterium]|nr:hypothetical protein [Planctomycetota bacterium]